MTSTYDAHKIYDKQLSFQQTPDAKFIPSELVLVGGGPRTAIQLNSEIVFMFLYQNHFEDMIRLGAHYDISTTVIEKQNFIGMGAAYTDNQTGMMNTGVEDDISFPLPSVHTSSTTDSLKSFLSYRRRYDNLVGSNLEGYFELVKSVNLPGAVMFWNSIGPNSTSRNRCLEHSRAYLLRGTAGQEETHITQTLLELGEKLLPFYTSRILSLSKVIRLNTANINCPSVVVESQVDGSVDVIKGGQIRLNCGTMTRSPVKDPALQNYVFCQAMNAHHFYDYCASRQLLDSSGLLHAGTKIVSGGLSLSGLDQLSVLDHVMHLFEEDDSALGFRVTEEAKARYPSSITLINRTPGNVCMPRHSFSCNWTQGTPVIGGAKHIHALFLHNFGEEVYHVWIALIRAAVARAAGITVSKARCENRSTESLLRSQYEDTIWFMKCRKSAGDHEKNGNMILKEQALKESTQTVYGAWRQAALGTIFGFGIQDDIETAVQEMREFAPVTWLGREFWLFHRGQIAALTNPKFATRVSNKEHLKNFDFLMKHVASSPVEMHSMLHLLLESGIAKYESASYGDIRLRESGNGLHLHGKSQDVFIVSPVFDRDEDKVVLSLAEQVQPFERMNPKFGKVGKFRRPINKCDQYVPVEDFGLSGKGFDVQTTSGDYSRAGSFAVDTNNRSSAVSVASSLTMRRMALAHLNAAGVPNAQQVLDAIYENLKPSYEAYEKEVSKFQEFFCEAFEMYAYVEAISLISGDNAQTFRSMYDKGLSNVDRQQQMKKLLFTNNKNENEGANMYFAQLKEIPAFRPPSRDEYFARFVDTTEEENVHLYTQALNHAKNYLQSM